jgi:two-component system, NarL family, nitrate/nitrite response regulator NarL
VPSNVKIATADDHPTFRDGLRRLLETEPDLQVIAEASNGADVVHRVLELKPDILLLDLAMPPRDGMQVSRRGGLDALRDLNSATPKTKTILFAAEIEAAEIVEAVQLGARGVLLKSAATQLLIESIREVTAGGYWAGTHSIQNLVPYLQSQILKADRRKFRLTPREIEIVSVVATGLSNKEIAQTLKIAHDTVKHHMSNIFDKLGVSSRLELAVFAFNQKLPLKDIV